MPTVAERVAQVLGAHATEVFGLLGNGNAFVVDALLRLTDARYTAVRHETATVASADAYWRASGKLAIATTTYGAGFTNTLTSLAEAAMAHCPMIVLVGDEPTSGRRPWDVDQVALARACGVETITVTAQTPGADTVRALELALGGGTPVVLALPYDLPTAKTTEPEFNPQLSLPEPAQPSAEGIEKLAALLAGAARPVILGGVGARDAGSELAELADRLGAITVTTAPARGLFAGRKLDAGVCGGFSSPRTADYLGQADLVVAFGAGLNQFTMGFGGLFPQATLAQVGIAESPTHPAVSEYLRADARAAALSLLDAIAGPEHDTWPGLVADEVADAQFDRGERPELAADGRLDPRGLISAIDAQLPDNRLVCTDGGHFIGWPNTHLRVPSVGSMVLVGTHYQSIGLGFPSAPGAAVAAGERMLVVPTGDGGGLMGLADLDSLVRSARRATVVVFNDAAYTAETTQYGTLGLDQRPMRIDEVDFAQLALGVGAHSTVVRHLSDLDSWAAWCTAGGEGTWVLDCRISGEVIAPYQREIMANLRRSVGK
ncbi:thiamine pyrophosphate-binding protein [Gulosibacter sp. GYB002]|uniref:thiamine pyrophosphate-binding protein n=1 Tax=Gulosibacter sp. GYB002 TaxID=2994391 RepID=UPI002F964B19